MSRDPGAKDALVIHSASITPGRPPSATLLLDIEVHNASAKPRWASLPGQLPPVEGGAFAVETLEAVGAHPFVAARILGRGGRTAWLLAPHATIRLSGVSLTWWGPLPDDVELIIEFCDSIQIGDTPLSEWLSAAPQALTDGASVALGDAPVVGSKSTEGLEEVAIALGGARTSATAKTSVAHRA
ncbi:MAG: hypothetical protein ABI577_18030 [bacterium]